MEDQYVGAVINNLSINAVHTNAGVFIGDNYQPFWSSHQKSNSGIGEIHGINFINCPINFVYDPDYIDQMLIND